MGGLETGTRAEAGGCQSRRLWCCRGCRLLPNTLHLISSLLEDMEAVAAGIYIIYICRHVSRIAKSNFSLPIIPFGGPEFPFITPSLHRSNQMPRKRSSLVWFQVQMQCHHRHSKISFLFVLSLRYFRGANSNSKWTL